MRTNLERSFPDVAWIFNRSSPDIIECSDKYYRPDARLDLDSHVVVVECDEDQHKHYDATCELKRINEVLMACSGRPLILLRWNPDEFTIQGEMQQVSETRRLTALKNAVFAAIETQPQQLLQVSYMYYDDVREQLLQQQLKDAMQAYLTAGNTLAS